MDYRDHKGLKNMNKASLTCGGDKKWYIINVIRVSEREETYHGVKKKKKNHTMEQRN